MTWDDCQKRSDELLSQSLWKLQDQPPQHRTADAIKSFGNYLICLDRKPRYIGEATNVQLRLKQQFAIKTSTFFKNYTRITTGATINDFQFKAMQTTIGRKEIEDFGIANISECLNKFQLRKRAKCVNARSGELWEDTQKNFGRLVSEGGEKAFLAQSLPGRHAKPASSPGIYFVRNSSTNAILYIGESSDLNERWCKAHCRSTYFSALRRHIATKILNFSLKIRNGKAKYLSESEEKAVSDFLDTVLFASYSVFFGRYELEEHLIRKHSPLLNRKGNSQTEYG